MFSGEVSFNRRAVHLQLWPNSVPGEYDMVFDANQSGIYDALSDVVDHPDHPGFIVKGQVPTLTQLGIVALVGLLSITAANTLLRRKRR